MSKKIAIPYSKLKYLYVKRRISTYKIAKIFNCDPTIIQRRLKEHNINIRKPKSKINISKKVLKELYWKEGLSTYKIARILKIGRTTTYNKLIEYNIKTRPKKVVKVSKKLLKKLYYDKKLPLSKIAKRYNCCNSIILRRMESYGLKRRDSSDSNTLYPKKKFDGNECLKAYMIGFRLGDLDIKKTSKNSKHYMLNTSTTKIEQIKLIKNVFGRYGHFYCKKIGKAYNINCNLSDSFKFLLPKEAKINKWITKRNNYFLAFLAGYTDAEGNIGIYSGRARYRLGSYDKNILIGIYKKLNKMGINTKFRLETLKGIHGNRKHNNNFYRLSVNNRLDLLKLFQLLKPYIQHDKRYEDLIAAEKNVIERIKK